MGSSGVPLHTSGGLGGFEWVGRGLLGCCGFIFSLSCGLVSVALYYGGSGARDLRGGGVHLARVAGFGVRCFGGRLARLG